MQEEWKTDREALAAWQAGQTGVPIVDAGMRQLAAGTGSDSKPYRRFNPLRQAERYDPAGDYVRRYVPESAGLAGTSVHRPWEHGGAKGYPRPIVGQLGR